MTSKQTIPIMMGLVAIIAISISSAPILLPNSYSESDFDRISAEIIGPPSFLIGESITIEGTVAPFVEEQPVVITIMNESGFVVIADEVFPQDRVFSAEYRLDYPLFKQAGKYTVLLRYFDAEQELVFFLSDRPLPQPTTSMIKSVNLRVQDVFGNPLDPNALPAGQQVQVAADLTNQLRESQQFAYIVRIYDLNDTTVSLAWITGVLSPGQSFTAALSWIPSMEGTQIIEVYVWNEISGDIIPLAPEQTLKIQVI